MIKLEQILYVLPILALSASITYYALTIRNQNKTRQTQLFMQTYQKVSTPELQALTAELLEWEWSDFDDFRDKYFKSTKKRGEWASIMLLFDGLGVLLKERYIDPKILFKLEQSGTRGGVLIWFKFKPIIEEIRSRENNHELLKHGEYFVDEMTRLRKQHGLPSTWSPEKSWWIKDL
jgi:hypothetical protein